jgi:hypothetical protein
LDIYSAFIIHKKATLLTFCKGHISGAAKEVKTVFWSFQVLSLPNCGYLLPKEEAVISGWDSQQSLRHIHCPKCGKPVTHTPLFTVTALST